MYNVHAPCKNAPRNIKPSSYSTPHFFLLEGEISNRIMPPKRETQKKTLSDFFPLGSCSNQKRVFFLQSNFLYIQLFLHNIRGLLSTCRVGIAEWPKLQGLDLDRHEKVSAVVHITAMQC